MRRWLIARRHGFMRRVRGHPPDAWMVARGLTLGRDVYINDTAFLDPDFLWLITVDDEAVLANRVQVFAHDGSTRHWTGYIRIAKVHIGRRVYVGAGAIILPGVTIGDGAIVGAGSVVRHDVPAGTVVVGNPAEGVGTVQEFADKHGALAQERPAYPSRGFSGYDDPTPENILRMQRELADGPGYVA